MPKRKRPSVFSRPARGEKRLFLRPVFLTDRFFPLRPLFLRRPRAASYRRARSPRSRGSFSLCTPLLFPLPVFKPSPPVFRAPNEPLFFILLVFSPRRRPSFAASPSPLSPPKNAPFCVLGKDIKRAARRSFSLFSLLNLAVKRSLRKFLLNY